ncbi:hypothetical protein TCON_2720 [Astathelohania contejeani]|uniref:HMG box domain-containing protein n=1 Tax=Astathelohania contejeani TaxID=164912 RepID=A0ABQ7HVB2_9MICR|nr:hypothetical protein TCON_2720 [Thelohania contejeani]
MSDENKPSDKQNLLKRKYVYLSKLFMSISNIYNSLASDASMTDEEMQYADKIARMTKRGMRRKRASYKTINGYGLFTREYRNQLKKDMPGLTTIELFRELGRIWRDELDEETKERYNALAAKETKDARQRAENEKLALSKEMDNQVFSDIDDEFGSDDGSNITIDL